jgi:ABC-type phosphate transport system substrate-binding protein
VARAWSFLIAALASGPLLAPSPAGAQTPAPAASIPRFTDQTLPRLDGSTSAEPLLALLACRSLGLTCGWHTFYFMELPRSMRPPGAVQEWPPVFPRSGDATAAPKLLTGGTHGAYAALVAGPKDLIVVARGPSEPERRMADQARVSLRVIPVAWDALVFVVNRSNAIGGLTLDQVRDVYAGRARRWSDLGGASPQPIRALVRDAASGSAELFAKHVTTAPVGETVSSRLIPTMIGVIDAVGSGPDDLGYTVYYYAKTFLETARGGFGSPGPHFKLIAIDGVGPTDETIAKGTYRLREPVYAVIRQDAPPPVAALHDWLSSADGQRLVSESGYLPVRDGGAAR